MKELVYQNEDRIHRSESGRALCDGDIVCRVSPYGEFQFGIAFTRSDGTIYVGDEKGCVASGAGWLWTILDNIYNNTRITDKINRNWQKPFGEFTELIVDVEGKRDFIPCQKIPKFKSKIERIEW